MSTSTQRSDAGRGRRAPVHRAWVVAAVAFVALVGAAGFRATPGVLLVPLEQEFGWSRGEISAAVSVNLVLFGLTAPFAAALMERFGIRRVTVGALLLVASGSGLTVLMTASWQLVLLWGVLVGLGTGSMALVFAATVANRWFVRRRGLVTGVLTAGSATGQLVFLPVLAALATAVGWRAASLAVTAGALLVVPLVAFFLRDDPAELGLAPYGAQAHPSASAVPATPAAAVTAGMPPSPGQLTTETRDGAARRAVSALATAARTRAFWLLAAGFGICGASTNGLIGTHFIPAAHDHGMPETTAAGLLALVGLFDVVGTIVSGALTDRFDPRMLLGAYYGLRGLSLLVLPALFAASPQPSMLVFIVFYGLDWVATVPPTVALCRSRFDDAGTVVFGWVFASHQLGAAVAATAAGAVRDSTGDYAWAWYAAGALCLAAVGLSLAVDRGTAGRLPELAGASAR